MILEDYLKLWGLCDLEKCHCLQYGWHGVHHCKHWHPCGAKTYEELGQWQAELKNDNIRKSTEE